MATLIEIREQLFNDSDFKNKCESAIIIATQEILSGSPTIEEKVLAEKVINDTSGYARKAMLMVIANNNDKEVNEILALDNGVLITEVKAAALLFTGV